MAAAAPITGSLESYSSKQSQMSMKVRSEIVLRLSWQGGQHSELRIAKNKRDYRNKETPSDATKVLETFAGRFNALADDSPAHQHMHRETLLGHRAV